MEKLKELMIGSPLGGPDHKEAHRAVSHYSYDFYLPELSN